MLFEKGFIFDYANEYVFHHPEPVDPRTWSLSDQDYQHFVNWMKDRDYSYTSYLEFGLQHLTEEAKKERYYADLKSELMHISGRIAESKKNELALYKNEIKMLLEEDIVAHFHLERGSIETGFKYDDDVKKAIEVLHNQPQYRRILNIQ